MRTASDVVHSLFNHQSGMGAIVIATILGCHAVSQGGEAGATPVQEPPPPALQARPQLPLFPVPQASAIVVRPAESKAAQIERLGASGSPADAFKAYQVAVECKRTRDAQRRGEVIADGALAADCGDITQLQLMGMGANLDKAAEAGVNGAVQELLAFGPLDGDASALDTRPSDPLVLAWKHKVQALFAAEANRGDLESMATLSQAYQIGFFDHKDAQLALAYEVARYDLLVRGTDPRHVGILKNGQRLAVLEADMTPQQIADATALGKKLVADCCLKPG